jgi:hypothetical protein
MPTKIAFRFFHIITLLPVIASTLVAEPLNVLLLTVDDMNCDSIGAFGSTVPGTTPNIDAFAAEAMRFNHAHVHATSCIPSRNAMQSGRYLFNSGIEGFYQLPKEQVNFKTIPDLLRENGYFTMIRGKSKHTSPYYPYPAWDVDFDEVKHPAPRDFLPLHEARNRGCEGSGQALLLLYGHPRSAYRAVQLGQQDRYQSSGRSGQGQSSIADLLGGRDHGTRFSSQYVIGSEGNCGLLLECSSR